MENQIIYLKSEQYGIQVSAYNKKNLSRVNIYKGVDVTIEIYDDEEIFNWNVKRDMADNYELSDKKTFDEVAKKFTETYNNLIKEL